MRPERVELEGFATFRDSTIVEFDDVDLVAFVGPTGSGKSTIIDAITFALFGSVARYGDARLVAPAIHQGSNEARVRLDFELGGEYFTAVRVVRRTKNGASTKEARLERRGEIADGASPVIASSAKEVTAAVEELLGLDFAQFTRTVVLPQGEFAKFLKDDPADRQVLLSRLLDFSVYARMGSRARELAKTASTKRSVLEQQSAQRADATTDALVRLEQQRAGLSTFVASATETLDAIDDTERQLVELRSRVAELDRATEAFGRVAMPGELTELAERTDTADRAVETAQEALDQARMARDQADDQRANVGDPSALRTQLRAMERLAEIDALLTPLRAEQVEAAEARTDAARTSAVATEAVEVARRNLEAASARADAAQWVSALEVGEPCPVCQNVVESLPDHDASAELAVAREAEQAAVAADRAGAAALNEIDHTIERLSVRIEEREAEADTLRTTAQQTEADESDTVEGLRSALDRAVALAETIASTSSAVKAAEQNLEQATAARRAIDTAEQTFRRRFGEQRDAVAGWTPPAPTERSLLDDWRGLAEWAGAQLEATATSRDDVGRDGKVLAAAKAEHLQALTAAAQPFGFDGQPSRSDLVRLEAAADAEIERLRERIQERAELSSQIEELTTEHQVNDQLGRLLSATGFERWLLSEALDDLVARATVRLLELSSNQFSLTSRDTTFWIIDHRNADQERDVRTLSGGETFLASLALALALSDSIAELAPVDSPRLGSMFLDEGFGTLDPETLDLVATAIEELSATGRLVGIVTHIDALAERMPVRFRVAKGPSSSTVEKVSS